MTAHKPNLRVWVFNANYDLVGPDRSRRALVSLERRNEEYPWCVGCEGVSPMQSFTSHPKAMAFANNLAARLPSNPLDWSHANIFPALFDTLQVVTNGKYVEYLPPPLKPVARQPYTPIPDGVTAAILETSKRRSAFNAAVIAEWEATH